MERGTYLPLLVSVKKVSNEPASPTSLALGSGRPSIPRPCSRRYLGDRSLGERVAAAGNGGEDIQLPCAVTQLGASLPNVQVKNLVAAVSASSLVYREICHGVVCGSQVASEARQVELVELLVSTLSVVTLGRPSLNQSIRARRGTQRASDV